MIHALQKFLLCLLFLSILSSCATVSKTKAIESFFSDRNTIYNNFDKFKENLEKAKLNGDEELYKFLKEVCYGLSWYTDNYWCFSTIKYNKYFKYIENEKVNIRYTYKSINPWGIVLPVLVAGAGVGIGFLANSEIAKDSISTEGKSNIPAYVLPLTYGSLFGGVSFFITSGNGWHKLKTNNSSTTVNGYKYYIGDLIVDEVNELVKKKSEYSDLLDIIHNEPFVFNPHLSSELSESLSAPIREKQEQERIQYEKEQQERAEKEKREKEQREKYISEYLEKFKRDHFHLFIGVGFYLTDYLIRCDYFYAKTDADRNVKSNEIEVINSTHPAVKGDNPYGYEKDKYYWTDFSEGSVAQWISDRSLHFMTDGYQRIYIYWDDSQLVKVFDKSAHCECLLLYEGIYEYKTANGGTNIVPKFKMIRKEYKEIKESELKQMAEESYEKEKNKGNT